MQSDTTVEMHIAYQQLKQRIASYLSVFKALRDFSYSQPMTILAEAHSQLNILPKLLQAIRSGPDAHKLSGIPDVMRPFGVWLLQCAGVAGVACLPMLSICSAGVVEFR